MTAIKICGVTSPADAALAVELGVDAIGLNFVPSSPRAIDVAVARAIVAEVAGRALVVAVVADLDLAAIARLRADTAVGCVQLHGDEPADVVRALLPHAYKAVRIGGPEDVARLADFPGEHVLADAKHGTALGGTGKTFDFSLVAGVARTRKLTLAGGLDAENVGAAIALVAPYCVDVASGVEVRGDPRRKDRARLAAFVAAVRGG